MKYRRSKVVGATYFFTAVTHNRRPFLCEPENIALLRNAFRYVKDSHPFIIDAVAILPEHVHFFIIMFGRVFTKLIEVLEY